MQGADAPGEGVKAAAEPVGGTEGVGPGGFWPAWPSPRRLQGTSEGRVLRGGHCQLCLEGRSPRLGDGVQGDLGSGGWMVRGGGAPGRGWPFSEPPVWASMLCRQGCWRPHGALVGARKE